jgi:predicted alpha/beta hydrolase
VPGIVIGVSHSIGGGAATVLPDLIRQAACIIVGVINRLALAIFLLRELINSVVKTTYDTPIIDILEGGTPTKTGADVRLLFFVVSHSY